MLRASARRTRGPGIPLAVMALALLAAACAGARTFVHPGIDCTRGDIERARAMVAAGREPWAASFAALKSCWTTDLGWRVPEYGVSLRTRECNGKLGVAGRRAHDLALMWRISDDERYARKAVDVLVASSRYENLDLAGTAPLDYGKVFLLCEAAELMRDYGGWRAEDKARFASMLRDRFYPVLKNGDPGRFGNQGLFALRAVQAMAIFLEDGRMYLRVWRYLLGLPHAPGDEPFATGPPVCDAMPFEVSPEMETFRLRGRRDDVRDYGYDEQLRHYIYANGQCQESSRDQGHVMAGLFMYVAIAEAFWSQGDDLYGALDRRLLRGLEWNLRYNLSDWEPSGFTDEEGEVTYANGLFYRARHRSGRWRSLSPSAKMRGCAGTEGAPRECALAHYGVRMGLGGAAVEWLARARDAMNSRSGGFETWGAAPNWHYEWSGWGSLVKRRTRWMAGDPPNGMHRIPCAVAAQDADVNQARRIEPSFTVASDKARECRLVVAYRSAGDAEVAFSCDGSQPVKVALPGSPRGKMAASRRLPVPAGASVVRWRLLSGGAGFRLVGFALE